MNSQEKRQLEHIIDPDILGEVRPGSFRKFGEIAVKCLAESGVDRPSMELGVCTSSPRASSSILLKILKVSTRSLSKLSMEICLDN
uniref:Putative ovule protein n=1 Tax=Solanum chacoense TaxID=4108 RepID=A0A0V0IFW7_SOLCH